MQTRNRPNSLFMITILQTYAFSNLPITGAITRFSF